MEDEEWRVKDGDKKKEGGRREKRITNVEQKERKWKHGLKEDEKES